MGIQVIRLWNHEQEVAVRVLGMAVACAAAALSVGAHAALITTSTTSFDAFSNGTVNGQGGWGVSNPSFNQSVVDLGGGNKALKLANTVTSGSFGDQTFAPRPGGVPADTVSNPTNGSPNVFAGESSTGATNNRFVASFDFRSVLSTVDPGARITVSPDNGSGARQGFLGLTSTAAGITVETFDVTAGGDFVGPTVLATYGFGSWHNIRYEIDFVDGNHNDVARIYLDNVLATTISSWESYYDVVQPAIHPIGVPVQTLLFRLSGASASTAEGFFIDNVVIQVGNAEASVPEPMSLGLVLAGLVGVFGLRRRA